MSLNLDLDVGTYTGNGGTNAISVGWQPCLVLTTALYNTGSPASKGWNYKCQEMADDDVIIQSTDAILRTANGNTLGSDGFTLGSDVTHNQNTYSYAYLAVNGRWESTQSGAYTGGGGTQTITLGRQPVVVLIARVTGTTATFWKFASMTGSNVAEFDSALNAVSAVTITSTGFQVTGDADTNGETFYYTALFNDATIHWETGTYTGNGATQSVTTGRQPNVVILFADDGDEIGIILPGMTTAIGKLTGAYAYDESGAPVITSTGFDLTSADFNASAQTHSYLVGYQ